MKVLVQLVGGQLMPNYIAAEYYRPDAILLCHTTETREEAEILRKGFLFKNIETRGTREISGFDDAANHLSAEEILSQASPEDEWILNYTGGTKQMSAGLYSAWHEAGRETVYVDTQYRKLHIRKGETNRTADWPTIRWNVEECLALLGHSVRSLAPEPVLFRDAVSSWMVQNRNQIQKVITHAASIVNGNESKARKGAEQWNGMTRNGFTADTRAPKPYVEIPEGRAEFDDALSCCRFIASGYFEEYVFNRLRCLNFFDDVKINVLIESRHSGNPYNEFDIVGIRKGVLYAVECKAGKVSQDHITKVAAITKLFGGTYAVPMLFCDYKPVSGNVIDRCRDYGVHLVIMRSQEQRLGTILNDIEAKLVKK